MGFDHRGETYAPTTTFVRVKLFPGDRYRAAVSDARQQGDRWQGLLSPGSRGEKRGFNAQSEPRLNLASAIALPQRSAMPDRHG